MDAATLAGLLGSRHVNDLLLRVIHHAHAFLDALGYDSAGDQRAVRVEGLDPIVVDDAGLLSVGLADPNDWTTPRQGQH